MRKGEKADFNQEYIIAILNSALNLQCAGAFQREGE
jgi:hypothetical protein